MEWNQKIITVYPFRLIMPCLQIGKLPSDHFLFQSNLRISVEVALDRLLYLADIQHTIKETPIETIIGILNRLTSGRISSGIKRLREICVKDDDILPSKIGLLDGVFRLSFKFEEPSNESKLFFNPTTNLNYITSDNFKYQSKSLRIVCNNEQDFYYYLLSEYGTVEDIDELLTSLLKTMEKINLDTIKPITIESLRSLPYFSEDLGIGSTNKKLYHRMIPFIESIRKPAKFKRQNIPKSIRDDLWDKYYHGKLKAPCYVCEREIDARKFEAGHVIPASKGGPDTLDNLRPICKECNRSMADRDLYEFKNQYYPPGHIDKGKAEATADDIIKDMVVIPRDYCSKLFFGKLLRVRVKDITKDYKAWCEAEATSYSAKVLEAMLEERGCEKLTDVHVFYTGVGLRLNKGMNDDERMTLAKHCSRIKDSNTLIKELQRHEANLNDIAKLAQMDIVPVSIREELNRLL